MDSNSTTLQLAMALIERPSVTPEDMGCQQVMIDRLENCGFSVTRLPFSDVNNFWAIHGHSGPIFCFAGHTDVVPPGTIDDWSHPPFKPTIRDGHLYGRGSADMKGSLAAMIVATEQFLSDNQDHPGRLAFLITSDEEGEAKNGTVRVVDWLKKQDMIPRWCIVGEPSSSAALGDTIKNGRRGSLSCRLSISGIQGHVAYPHLADNPIHLSAPALNDLIEENWDNGNDFFPPTSFQISNINAGTGANNVIPGSLGVLFNFRFSTEVTDEDLRMRVKTILDKHNLSYHAEWHLSGQPFLTPIGELVDTTIKCITDATDQKPTLSTAGGTSDARFIAPMGTQVIELGPINKTIHRVDENVSTVDLDTLTEIYKNIVNKLLC